MALRGPSSLGSAAGLVGTVLAALGAGRFVHTDLDRQLPLLRADAALNDVAGCGRVRPAVLVVREAREHAFKMKLHMHREHDVERAETSERSRDILLSCFGLHFLRSLNPPCPREKTHQKAMLHQHS